jgi:hypothetical protein
MPTKPRYVVMLALLCAAIPAPSKAQTPALGSTQPYPRGTLRSSLRVGKTVLPAGTEIFRSTKKSMLYRKPGMPEKEYLGISRAAFGRALGRALARSNTSAEEGHKKAVSDLVDGLPNTRHRWHDGPVSVRLSNRQVKGVENLSRMFGLPDSTLYGAVPGGLTKRMSKTIGKRDVQFHADGRVTGMDNRSTRHFSTKPGALKVTTWTDDTVWRSNRSAKSRSVSTATTFRGKDGARVDHRYTVGRRSGPLKKLARALGLKVQAGDELSYSVDRSGAGGMTLGVKLQERGAGKASVERSYRVIQQSRGVQLEPID